MLEQTPNETFNGYPISYKATYTDKNGEPAAYLYIQTDSFPKAVLHNEILEGKMSHNVIKRSRVIFEQVKKELKAMGFNELIVFVPYDKDTRWDRYIQLFDFNAPVYIKLSAMRI